MKPGNFAGTSESEYLLFVESESCLEELEDLVGAHVRGREVPDDVSDGARRTIHSTPFVGEAWRWSDAPSSSSQSVETSKSKVVFFCLMWIQFYKSFWSRVATLL